MLPEKYIPKLRVNELESTYGNIEEDLIVGNTLSVGGTITGTTGDINYIFRIAGELSVSGITTIANQLSISGNTTINTFQ